MVMTCPHPYVCLQYATASIYTLPCILNPSIIGYVCTLFSSAVGMLLFIIFIGHSGYAAAPCGGNQVCIGCDGGVAILQEHQSFFLYENGMFVLLLFGMTLDGEQ